MPAIEAIAALPWPLAGRSFRLPEITGSADAMLIASLASRQDRPGPLAVIAAHAVDAQRLLEEITYFAPRLRVALFPDWETLPYDALSPHQDLISERLSCLNALQGNRVDVILMAASTLMQRLAPPSFLASYTFHFDQGQNLDEPALRQQLVRAGYEHVTQVVRAGEYSVRGGIIDLFPMGTSMPYRIDLFGDEIESIKTFDPDTQRSLYPVSRVRLLPSREFPTDEESRQAFRGRWRERFEGDPSRAPIYRDIANGVLGAGIEYYLPLFFERTGDLFDYLPASTVLVLHGDIDKAMRSFIGDARERHRFLSHDPQRPILDPGDIYLGPERVFERCRAHGRLTLRRDTADSAAADAAPTVEHVEPDAVAADTANLPDAGASRSSGSRVLAVRAPRPTVDRRAESPVHRLRDFLDACSDRVLVMAESPGRLETLIQLFGESDLHLPVVDGWASFERADIPAALTIGPLHDGFVRRPDGLVLITETELFSAGTRRRRRASAASVDPNTLIRDLSELKIGDPVVHQDHGIGRYQGLVDLDFGDGPTEFLHLTYQGDAQLYVPVSQLHQISRYAGASPEDAPLHSLGSGQWEKARKRAAKQARDTAAELLNLYARRAARHGHAFKFDAHDYEAFADGFGFDETPDQLAAIHAVVQDMISDKPMDRLVCGDVGFGKTEVALRAAFLAVSGGRQVMLLAPTTLLAEQHYETFRDRFADWPVQIAQLSRFRSAKEVRQSLDGLASGQVDIAIGTHKLLSAEVRPKRLGLVIIDEEHRFGVRQKERLKALRAEIDVLTLTATPIPRTLAMSLEGIRDFSVIATAPERRLAIKTFVRQENKSVIREAILRELKRGGQVYFLHNEVQTIENRRQMLAELVPEATIAIAHGQMPERELERVMREFHQQRFNLLLCTTIIETGIDVPTANTIVIHRADRFGLAQLHQLRGRVGRSHHQAYAYLLTPEPAATTRDAQKRLEAIQSLEELGAGFFLAMHDLEIRGAGEVLGDSQSGNMQEVGFSLYTEMLEQAVQALRSGREPDMEAPLASTTEIKLHVPALLPGDYCPDVRERLVLYKRLANCNEDDDLIRLREELIDRFGRLPEQAAALIETHRLRVLCTPLGVAKIDAAEALILIQFVSRPPIEPAAIIAFMQSRRDTRLAGEDRLRIEVESRDLTQRVQRIREIIAALKRHDDQARKR
ncbi:MAG: transcription-repair coupling factor [Burkholderiaceae bacterium]